MTQCNPIQAHSIMHGMTQGSSISSKTHLDHEPPQQACQVPGDIVINNESKAVFHVKQHCTCSVAMLLLIGGMKTTDRVNKPAVMKLISNRTMQHLFLQGSGE